MNDNIDSNLRTPVVMFEYPDSQTRKMRLRWLRVVEANENYIKGYELDSPTSLRLGQFKTFSRNRLTFNSPTLISF